MAKEEASQHRLHRGCGCNVGDVKRTRTNHRLNNETQAAKERKESYL